MKPSTLLARPLQVLSLGVVLTACSQVIPPALTGPPDVRLSDIKRVAWGTPQQFAVAEQALAQGPWADLDWKSDGCSVPLNLNTPFRTEFTPACRVHDFAYNNLRVLEPTAQNRKASDEAFYGNMQQICSHQTREEQEECQRAAWAYYKTVRLWGYTHFAPGT